MNIDELVERITDEVVKELKGLESVEGLEGCAEVCSSCGQCVTNRSDAVKNIISVGADRIGAGLGIGNAAEEMASYIDHTLLKPEATVDDVQNLCQEAAKHGFASVCVNPWYVKLCAQLLKNSSAKVCTVIGFPLGATTTETKAFETETALREGATEFDMVINIGALKSKEFDYVKNDIMKVVEKSGTGNIVKVIIETALLTDEEKVVACELAKRAGANFVKTSTGFSKGGATVKDVALMRSVVADTMGVKASGGIRDFKTALEMVKAGATRIGASAGVKIVSAA